MIQVISATDHSLALTSLPSVNVAISGASANSNKNPMIPVINITTKLDL